MRLRVGPRGPSTARYQHMIEHTTHMYFQLVYGVWVEIWVGVVKMEVERRGRGY
jgi:hypothetical protein